MAQHSVIPQMSHGKQFTLYTNVSGSNGWYIWLLTRSLEQLTEVVVAGSGHQESRYRSGGIGIDLRIHLFDLRERGTQGSQLPQGQFERTNTRPRRPQGQRLCSLVSGEFHDCVQRSLAWNARHRESLAIIQYLVNKYDPEHKISSVGEAKYLELQWLAFQISGQGLVHPGPLDPERKTLTCENFIDHTSAKPRDSKSFTARRSLALLSDTTTRSSGSSAFWSRSSPSVPQATSSEIRQLSRIWRSSRGTKVQRPGWRLKG